MLKKIILFSLVFTILACSIASATYYMYIYVKEPFTLLYRKPIYIFNSGSELAGYQVLVTLNTADLISAGKMQDDCGDIRFNDTAETTLLSYSMESGCNSESTKLWVDVPLIPAGEKTIYMHYGNSRIGDGFGDYVPSDKKFTGASLEYRKPIDFPILDQISNSGSELTGYQVLVTLDTASLISAGKMQDDCGDIRFNDSDEQTLLDYWVETRVENIDQSTPGWKMWSGGGCGCGSDDCCDPELVCQPPSGWTDIGYDDSGWSSVSLPNTGWGCDSCTRAYRNTFNLNSIPSSATVYVGSDDGARCYMNGNLIGSDGNCHALTHWNYEWIVDPSYFVHGQNVLSCQVADRGGPDGFEVRMYVGDSTCNSDSTKIWVKVPSIPVAGKTIYMHYGNSGEVDILSTSNGNNVFEFFDDFLTADTSKFSYGESYDGYSPISYIVDDGLLKLHSDDSNWKILRMKKNFGPSDNVIVNARFMTAGDSRWLQNSFVQSGSTGRNRFDIQDSYEGTNTEFRVQYNIDGGGWQNSGTIATLSSYTWYQDEIIKKSSTYFEAKIYTDSGNLLGSFSHHDDTENGWSDETWTWVNWKRDNVWSYQDWVFARKYASEEPGISIGSEEGSSMMIYEINIDDEQGSSLKLTEINTTKTCTSESPNLQCTNTYDQCPETGTYQARSCSYQDLNCLSCSGCGQNSCCESWFDLYYCEYSPPYDFTFKVFGSNAFMIGRETPLVIVIENTGYYEDSYDISFTLEEGNPDLVLIEPADGQITVSNVKSGQIIQNTDIGITVLFSEPDAKITFHAVSQGDNTVIRNAEFYIRETESFLSLPEFGFLNFALMMILSCILFAKANIFIKE